MIQELCSCGAKFTSTEPDAPKLWREWQRKHNCPDQEPEIQTTTAASMDTGITIGFAPTELPGRIDPALE